MGDTNHGNNQPYGSNSMQTDSNDLNTILAQMPTPVSNDIRASETNTFMSPLQVDQQSYDRMNGVQFSTHGNDEVYTSFPIIAYVLRCSLRPFFLLLSLPWTLSVFTKMTL